MKTTIPDRLLLDRLLPGRAGRRGTRRGRAVLLATAVITLAPPLRPDEILLLVDPPDDGLVVTDVDLTPALRACGVERWSPEGLTARASDGREVPVQFVPGPGLEGPDRIAGTIALRLESGDATPVRLVVSGQPARASGATSSGRRVETPWYIVEHDPRRQGGLPWRISFPGSATTIEDIYWQDRAHHPEAGSFRIADDRSPVLSCVSHGPLATVVRVRARFVAPDGASPPSRPSATYDWWYLHDRPAVRVSVVQRQEASFAWREMHFLELHTGDSLPRWAGERPRAEGTFTGSKTTHGFDRWAAVSDGSATIATLASGRMLIHDGRGGYGSYLHARGSLAWSEMGTRERRTEAWLRIAKAGSPWEGVRAAAAARSDPGAVVVTTSRVREAIESIEREARTRTGADRRRSFWRAAAARKLEAEGRLEAALRAASEGEEPETWHRVEAGELGVLLERTRDGLRVLEALDALTGSSLLAPHGPPLFRIRLRRAGEETDAPIRADRGWRRVSVESSGTDGVELRWEGAAEVGLDALRVVARVRADAGASALRWRLRVGTPGPGWSIRHVEFPLLAVADLGPGAAVVFPRGAGEVRTGLWGQAFRFGGRYPSGWVTMPWMAAYRPGGKGGLYVGVHDPAGSTREILLRSDPAERAVTFSFEEPAADMGRPGAPFDPSGEAVWQLVRGDWFDAARIYRDWARAHASWWPKLTAEGRADTPRWMRELSVWTMTGGPPETVVPAVKEFRRKLGVPVGLHWYNWHEIPFDNDYPHYFPTKRGFAAGVAELQASGVHVMPYINGRLWDTRDRGAEDHRFGELARPAATKDESGNPRTETYRSKESDGSPVRLAVMCPSTSLWQDRVAGIVDRLLRQERVHAVYIDQVAAARPELCLDASHGHPLGGGSWWTASYHEMLRRIRREMPEGRVLTTECNADPYVHVFDGYLTWHWQYDGQVPAFPAVYGGAIQMFGRAYRGGPTRELAFRMKAGQQLVFGEQIGWCDPREMRHEDSADFLRRVVLLRHELRRYFHAGEMARPPRLEGELPSVKADWQWSGVWPVTTDAVLTGAWTLTRERRWALLFTNVSDEEVSGRVLVDAASLGWEAARVSVTRVTSEGRADLGLWPRASRRDVTFAPRSAWAWEVTPDAPRSPDE